MPKKDILSSKRAQKCALPPIQSVVFVTQSGPRGVSSGEISPEIIGWKAYGLCCMPSGWVPPFFVISGSCLDGSVSDEILRVWVNECAETTGVTIKTKSIMIRSSGTSETIRNRGQLISSCCSLDGVLEIIKKSISLLPASLSGTVHWIVQECIDSKEKGHLSNERHLRREKEIGSPNSSLKNAGPVTSTASEFETGEMGKTRMILICAAIPISKSRWF